jgi:signal transduction histidine kinase
VRRRLVISTIAIVLVVLSALALPIGLVVYDAAERELDARLDQQAGTIESIYSGAVLAGRLPDLGAAGDVLGPSDGLEIRLSDGTLVVGDPLPAGGATRNAVRIATDGARIAVSTDADPLDENFRDQMRLLVALALGAIIAAAGLAAVQARQLARPLERLATRAGRIGMGDFSVQPFTRTRIPEIDHIGSALDTSAERVETMLANERHFTADATHQLRTGIAGIAMRLEILTMTADPSVAAEAAAGLAQTDQLNATINDLLAAARSRTTNEQTIFDLDALVSAHVAEWEPRFMALKRHISVITANPAPPVFGTTGLAGQVIDILIDNTVRHGAGAVTLMIDGPSVTVIDQGPGVPAENLRTIFDGPVDPAARHGRGLPLARRLAQVDGASLDVIGNHPLRFRFQLVRGDHATRQQSSETSESPATSE